MSGTIDFSGFAPAMSPGQAGVGGFVAPTADDPLTSASQTGNDPATQSWWQQNMPSWAGGNYQAPAGSSLQGALSTLSKANPSGGSEKAGGPAPMQMQGAQGPQGAGVSRSSGAGELAALLAALDARRNLLLQSATSGQARPVANPASPYAGGATRQTTGLLGI